MTPLLIFVRNSKREQEQMRISMGRFTKIREEEQEGKKAEMQEKKFGKKFGFNKIEEEA